MFDMAVAGKKCALYLPDLSQYLANERGLYFDIEALPFPKGRTMEEFCLCLREFEGYEARCREFLEQIGSFEDGNAAAAVAKRIEEVCYG
jgi:CDP-glycerol glycerophosphotransferase